MARKRDRNGRFKKTRGKSRRRVTRRRKKGVGAIGSPMVDAFVAPMVGGGSAAAATLAVRKFVDPTKSKMKYQAVKWAGLVGGAVGLLASGALYFFAGRDMETLTASVSGAVLTSLSMTLHDQLILNGDTGLATGAAISATNYAALTSGSGGNGGSTGTEGIGRMLPQRRAVSPLAGVNTGAFGRSF